MRFFKFLFDKFKVYMKNKLNFVSTVSIGLVILLSFLILFSTYYVSKNIAVSAELNSAKNTASSLSRYLEYKLNIIEVQANSFANNPEVVKLVTQYDKIDDYERYAIDNAIQQYLNAISDTTKVISFILYVPKHPNITPQLRGQSPYNVNTVGQNRKLIEQIEIEGWGVIPNDLEYQFGADESSVNQAICYFKWIGDKRKKEGVVIFGVNYELIGELLDEVYANGQDEFMIVANGKVVYKKTKMDLNFAKQIGMYEYVLKNKRLIYHCKVGTLPLEAYIAKQVDVKGFVYIPFIIFLIITILAWKIISLIIGNIKKELIAIGTYMSSSKEANDIKLLKEFYNSSKELIKNKEEISKMNIEITKKLSIYLENALKSVNSVLDEIYTIEERLDQTEGIWYKMKELLLNISDNINKIVISENRFYEYFENNNRRVRDEVQKLREVISVYQQKIEDLVNKRNDILDKLKYVSTQIEKLKELENFNKQNIDSLEQLDIISLNSMIKTAKDESDKSLNVISQQLIYQTKLLKSNLLKITDTIQNIVDDIFSASEYSDIVNQADSDGNYKMFSDEIGKILNYMNENEKSIYLKTDLQKEIMKKIQYNYNTAFDEIAKVRDYFYELIENLRDYKSTTDSLKEQLNEILEIILKLKKQWSE